ncbi:MAG: ribosomal protein S18-alanine N-acetyltransferase [Fimbriimonadaceae bacterium]|nr:ribosomal protein S18-alanine N-acetyltransferase [Fimbriimonadaceae bacterium]
MAVIRFEPLSDQHIPAILEIEKDANSAPWSERSFKNELTNAQSVFAVALIGAAVVGYGGAWIVVDESHITTVAVHKDYRGQGIGLKIMREILKESKQRGAICSTLEVRASNQAAIHLYEKLGYVLTASRKKYYPDNNEDAVIMWLHEM